MRNRCKKNKHYPQVMEAVGRNYNRLYSLCCNYDARNSVLTNEDAFQDTVIYISHDSQAIDLTDDNFIAHFCYRFKMVAFQNNQDAKQRKEVPYADYLQAKETTE